MDNLKNFAMMPGRTLNLQTFKGVFAEGTQGAIHKLTMARMDAGDASFMVSPYGIEGRILEVMIRYTLISVSLKRLN